ncbi:MAG TPA: TIGR00645 family protein [Acetobacteraceae bacterium]|jgi:uncharacterized protein (TIGR00645 family)|nr:TIGR00645 family protein [Acetobacteraceae bacterium]
MSGPPATKTRTERQFERIIFASRWLMGPFYVGLVVTLGMMLFRFALDLFAALIALPRMTDKDIVVMALRLVDLTLVANLLLIVTFAGYENFVGRMAGIDEQARAAWMGKVDFGAMKIKVVGSTIAISSIYLLSTVLNVGDATREQIVWTLAIQGGLILSGLALAAIDRLSAEKAE